MKQLSVFLENKHGKLLTLTNLLKANNINIRTITIAETPEFGIARMIVDEIERAENLLKENEFACRQTDVLAVEIDDKPGGLSAILEIFDKSEINIEYMYGFLEKKSDNAIMIFRVKDNQKAQDVLTQNDIKFYNKTIN